MTEDVQTASAVDSIIDAAIDAPATETTDNKAENAETKPEGEQVKKTYTEDDVKKYERDLDRERRRIGKITAQKYQFKSEADQLRAQIAELQKKLPQANAEPQLSNYTDFNKYQQDVIDHRINLANAEKAKTSPQQPTQEDYQKQLWRTQRTPALLNQVKEAAQTFPDIQAKMQANVQLLDSLPQHVADAFLEADHGALAIYQLLEDGMIPHLAGMNAETVQAFIERAEDKALLRQKPVTKAPAPMTSARGTAPASKSLEAMSGAELLAWSKS